ncbi:MAG: hypothetical protein JW934_01865 [Anaerolineae bacterium]|nr:hypothetical protein [Anaerolineae bacterium]
MQELYPLRFKEILRNYGFGDRWIVDAFDKDGLPGDHRIAETWEVCDRPGESSEVINGALTGKTLHEIIDLYGEPFLGRDVVARCGVRFPLLIKFLDASNVLGEQSHHSDELAAQHGLTDPGKTEAWYMLKTRPGATIRCGHVAGTTPERVRAAVLDGTIKELMPEYAIQPGDAFLLYAGAMHYSAGGALLYEIMQNSDVYIGLRPPPEHLTPAQREAWIALAVAGVNLEAGFDPKTVPVTVQEGENRHTWVLACPYFALERLDLVEPYTIDCDGERFYVLSQIEGTSTVACGAQRVPLKAGQTCLLPADLGVAQIVPGGACALLKAYVPDLGRNVIEPLRRAGVPQEGIAALGGQTTLNALHGA